MSTHQTSVLVTGGAGFIGSHIVGRLVEDGCRVRVVDNLTTGRKVNLEPIRNGIEFIEGDFSDPGILEAALRDVEVVFHLAAVVSVPETVADPVGSARVNDLGTLMLLEGARQHRVRRVVISSSCAVYGDSAALPVAEAAVPDPKSPYAAQKQAGEIYARVYHVRYGLETVCLRYFNVYGPRQDPSSPYSGVISIFMDRAADGRAPTIYGDGRQTRDFVFVDDVVRANILAAEHPAAAGGVFNVGTGDAVRINALWQMVCALSGRTLDPVYAPARAGDILASAADTTRAAEVLAFSSSVALIDGLQRTWDWYCR